MAHPNLFYYRPTDEREDRTIDCDICIYGATSGGVVAAIHAAQQGKRVALLAFGTKVGGLSAGGLGCTDYGKKDMYGGLAMEFYRRMGVIKGEAASWYFEASVAERVYEEWLKEAKVPLYRRQVLESAEKEGSRLRAIRCEDGSVYRAEVFIDASYEGDLMALAGVSWVAGRESSAQYGEVYNGRHFGHPNHNFHLFVDPYREEGRPSSGLLPGISDDAPGLQGEGDNCIQAYNFRVCLSRDPQNQLPFSKPDYYDPERFTLLARYLKAGVWDALQLTSWVTKTKSDTNNWGGFSSDNIGMNHPWPDASYAEREVMFQDHVTYNQGLYWFLRNDPRVPEFIRAEVSQLGLPADEFTETGGWPHELYVREARRMVSEVVVTEHDCVGAVKAHDPVALATYHMDSHNCRRIVFGGRAYNEGNVEIMVPRPFPISYRAIVPRRAECENLLVPWCLSASHTAFGSIRMEPVFMTLGQASAEAAIMAIDRRQAVQDVDYPALRERLLSSGGLLDYPPGDGFVIKRGATS